MRIFRAGIFGILVASYVAAVELSGVFTSLNSITSMGASTYGYVCNVGWELNPLAAKVGDTFTLDMPYVFTVLRIENHQYVTAPFDLIVDGVQLATCNVDQGTIQSMNSSIHCEVTADLSPYSAAKGTLEFTVLFNMGVSAESLEAAKYWKVGSNIVTFNGDISTEVTLPPVDELWWGNSWYEAQPEQPLFFYTPLQLCGGQGIKSGNLTYAYDYPYNDPATLTWSNIEVYMSNQFSNFYSPETAEDIPGLSIEATDGIVVATFGAIPPGYTVWFSGVCQGVNIFNYPDFIQTTSVVCADGTTDSNKFGYYLIADPANITVTGQLYVAFTSAWDDCQTTQTTTSTTTGTDGIVTEIVREPNGSICFGFSSKGGSSSLSSASPDLTTTTTTWTGVYTTSYITTGTDLSSTVVIEVPSSSGGIATTTTTWTGVYTTSYLTTGTDLSSTVVIEVPSSSGGIATTTTTWTGVYITSYLTTGTDSSVTEIVEVPSSFVSLAATATTPNTSNTEKSTTVLTITSCSGSKCSTLAITTGLTVVTVTKKGVVTSYTTYCPLTTDSSIVNTPSTTVVDITSCSNNKCSIAAITTGVTTVTSTSAGVIHTYTTYCPLNTASSSNIALSPGFVTSLADVSSDVSKTSFGNGLVQKTTDIAGFTPAISSGVAGSVTTFSTHTTLITSVSSTSPAISTQQGSGLRLNGMSKLLFSLISISVLVF